MNTTSPKPKHSNPAREPCRLYLITPPKIDLRPFAENLKQALDGGDVAAVQLRLKDCLDDDIRRSADHLGPIIKAAGAAFLINDRPDLARACDADGVHIGQDDAPYAQARALLGPDAIIGVTCHDSRHLAMEAAEAGADYVAFGAFFPTATKSPKAQADPDILAWWQALMETPCVAIGGISVDNAAAMALAGADFVAVSAGVWTHPDGPKAAVCALSAAISL